MDFALEPILALRLRVLDAKTKTPIPHLQATAWIAEEAATRIPFWWLRDPNRPGRRGWSRPLVPESGEVLVSISELRKAGRLTLVLQAEGYKERTVESLRASPRPEMQTILLHK